MKRAVMLALMVTGLMAGDEGLYIGMDIGDVKVNSTVTSGANTYKGYASDPAYTFKGGYYLNENNRVYAFYQYVNPDTATASFSQYGAGYDYMIGSGTLKPFIGIFAGWVDSKVSNSQDNFDISGNLVGVQAGISYAMNANLSVEGGYRYFDYSNADGLESIDNVNVKADTTQNWYVGLNYKF